MRSSTLLTSAFAAGALALPQGQLEKRQQATVTTTVTFNPYATPAWAGPPKFSQTANPVWTAPRVDAGRTSSTRAPAAAVPASSSTRRATSSTRVVSSTRAATSSRVSTTSRPGVPANTANPVGGVPASSLRPVSSAVIGAPISNTPVPSNAVPAPTAAPLDPGHTPGTSQALLSPADGTAYINAILFHHNEARANHNAAPLVWNTTVAATAAITANTCNFAHYIPPGAGQGQNLYTTSGNYFNVTAGITEQWYKGEFQAMLPYFGMASIPNNVFENVGHLTQVLWKGTTSVGCYSLDCGNRMLVGGQTSTLNKYTVCNYYPAGNVGTQYAINVGRPISTTNLGRWTD